MQRVLAIVTVCAPDTRVEDQSSIDPALRVVRVWVNEPPEKGRANAAVVEVVAHHLRVAPSSVKVIRGRRGRRKLLEIRSA